MAAKDKDPDPEPQDEDYDSNEDEDFNPENAPAADDEVSASSDSEDDGDNNAPAAKKAKAKTAKRKAPDTIEEELDSGDEATIKERKRKRRKGKDAEEDSGGEGGLIKTRAQRLVEKAERKERRRADRGEVTVDVDDLWARLNAVPVGRHYEPVAPQAADGGDSQMSTTVLAKSCSLQNSSFASNAALRSLEKSQRSRRRCSSLRLLRKRTSPTTLKQTRTTRSHAQTTQDNCQHQKAISSDPYAAHRSSNQTLQPPCAASAATNCAHARPAEWTW